MASITDYTTADGRYSVNAPAGESVNFLGLHRDGDGNAGNNEFEYTTIRGYPWTR